MKLEFMGLSDKFFNCTDLCERGERMKNKLSIKWGAKRVIFLALFILIAIFCTVTAVQYHYDKKGAYENLASYNAKIIDTEFGVMSYVDEGVGDAVLISHGIFGGYDQGSVSLNQILGSDYRKIAISRFGYPGSALPENPTPKNQAKVFLALLDELGIEQSYILATSAGGAASFQFALDYPQRTKGLILLSSGVPDKKRTAKEVKELGMMGPPAIIVNDFPMWFCLKYFGFVMNAMMGGEVSGDDLLKTMLPVGLRRQGVIADTRITNVDMTLNYEDYPLENLEIPMLVIHAKDDPMVRYADVERVLERIDSETAIYETGGHLIVGQDSSARIKEFFDSSLCE